MKNNKSAYDNITNEREKFCSKISLVEIKIQEKSLSEIMIKTLAFDLCFFFIKKII